MKQPNLAWAPIVFPAHERKMEEPTSELEPLICLLRVINRVLQGLCTGLRISPIQEVSSPPICWVLQHVAFAVVSKWSQEFVDHKSPVSLRSIRE